MDPSKRAAECVQWQHKVTMANLCIRQYFPSQNPKPTDLPKFYLTKVLPRQTFALYGINCNCYTHSLMKLHQRNCQEL